MHRHRPHHGRHRRRSRRRDCASRRARLPPSALRGASAIRVTLRAAIRACSRGDCARSSCRPHVGPPCRGCSRRMRHSACALHAAPCWRGRCARSSGGGGGDIEWAAARRPTRPVDFPIAYVKRPHAGRHPPDATPRLRTFLDGARPLRARPRLAERARAQRHRPSSRRDCGDVRDLEPSWDGRKLVFAMRGPLIEGATPRTSRPGTSGNTTFAARTLARVITSDIIAEEGHDVAPHYLPDGRIVFSSTRQRQSQAVLLDEGKPQFEAHDENRAEPAFVLHVMNADGTDIHQISFNQSHDLDPTVLTNGRVLFSRWDNAGSTDAMHLYTVNPDGSDVQLLYGARQPRDRHRRLDGAVPRPARHGGRSRARARASLRGHRARRRPGRHRRRQLRREHAADPRPTPACSPARRSCPSRRTTCTTIPGPSPGGRFSAAYPLWDGTGRILVSWTQCRLLEAGRIVPCTAERLAVAAPQRRRRSTASGCTTRATARSCRCCRRSRASMITDIVARSRARCPP